MQKCKIRYIFFQLNCNHYHYISNKKNHNLGFKSQFRNKLAFKL